MHYLGKFYFFLKIRVLHRPWHQHQSRYHRDLALPTCEDTFIRKRGVNYKEIDQESQEVISHPENDGELDASVSFHDAAAKPPDLRCRGQP
jgi:hypothetical protein